MGAEVYVCPTNVDPDHPESYYSVAKRLNKEIPNSFYPNQYDNLSNKLAHYESTGPEIWRQTEGKLLILLLVLEQEALFQELQKYLKERKIKKNKNLGC